MTDNTVSYLFVHLQKTAGTALLRRLRHALGPEAVYPLPAEQGSPEVVLDVERLRRRLAEPDHRFQVVTGHFPLATAELLGGEVATFTVMRDPVERVLSFLRHQREVEPRFADATLDEVYADPVSTGGLVRDHMVKMLSLTPQEMTNGALSPVTVDGDRLHRAKRNLVERVDVVGLQEHFDTFCSDLEVAFGWDLGPPLFMNRTAPAGATDTLRDRIALDNAYDREFYETAVDLWAGRHPSSQAGT